MEARKMTLGLTVIIIALFASPSAIRAQTGTKAGTIAAITKLENDSVKADLASDKTFYARTLADDWTGGDSDGVWFTKADALKMMDDKKNNMTSSEKISALKVRVYGDTAVATYSDTYDGMMDGKRRARTVISTNTFVKMGSGWKLVASHSAMAK